MITRASTGLAAAITIVALGATPTEAQLSGRVVVRDGPIAVDVVFGPEYRAAGHDRPEHRGAYLPVRYRRGMSLWALERYLDRIEYEYRLFRQMDPRDAYYAYGWSSEQLRDYVRFLRDERRFLRAEREWLRRPHRFDRDRPGHPGRGGGGRGRGGRGG